jgi:hypothetical protein
MHTERAPFSLAAEFRYYRHLLFFRLQEPFTDFKATGITYALYCFFIWLLSHVWLKFNHEGSDFTYSTVFLYIGFTEMLFMSFLSMRSITSGSEDFSLFLARPRSWIGREITANIGANLGKRCLFFLSLIAFALLLGVMRSIPLDFVIRFLFLLGVLAIPQALLATLFSTLRLSFPQTDYFVLPFTKLFLALGGVFGPLSDYGEPWRSYFMYLPGADLFFQPAYFAVHGKFYESSMSIWLLRQALIDIVLFSILLFFYQRGRKNFQAWGG